jgi:hypothetical protein
VQLIKDPKSYPDEYYVEVMDSMYLPIEASYNGLRTIDVDKLKFVILGWTFKQLRLK